MMKDRSVKLVQCVEVHVGGRRVNEEDEGTWLMDFIYLYEIEQ
jgi:hypothetical protein